MADQQYFYGTGRRKTAVARVRLYPGNGAVVVNGKPMEEIFTRDIHRAEVTSALRRLGKDARFSAQIKCEGGGVSGWSGAIQMGIARALVASDPALKPVLKSEEKPKKPAAQAAAKPKATEDGEDAPPKKEVNPLDLLPPSPFDLFNFKTFYVNHPDKAGEGFNAFMEQVDR